MIQTYEEMLKKFKETGEPVRDANIHKIATANSNPFKPGMYVIYGAWNYRAESSNSKLFIIGAVYKVISIIGDNNCGLELKCVSSLDCDNKRKARSSYGLFVFWPRFKLLEKPKR